MKSSDYLNEIRKAEGLRRAVLKKIVVEGRDVVFHLLTDVNYTDGDCAAAERVSQAYVPAGYTARVRVMKSVPGEEGVKRAVAETLKKRFPAAAAFVSPEDIRVSLHEGGGGFFIAIGDEERAQFTDAVLDELSAELNKTFCGVWTGELCRTEKARGDIVREELPPPETVYAPRIFPIENYAPIDGAHPENAVYIADLTREMRGISVCGRLTYLEERESKRGTPYFTMTVSDGTGSLRTSYFPKKATVEKVRALERGTDVCLTGDNELFNGGLSFRAKAVDFGSAPENFVPEARPSRPVPPRYVCTAPSPVSDFVQSKMFGELALPASFLKRKFVVFDLETTGLNNTPAGGGMDRIIEVGAVKIEEGRIAEKFSTFVACPVRLSAEIVTLTGITDEMLAGAPPIQDVIADFYKFCDGCELVGHNVQFDSKFIRYYGEKEGYLFDQKQYDTVSMAQEMLRLSNYKLNTVADHFGFVFHHHRAYDDAFVTAKIFLELVKLRKGLPR